MTDPSARIIVLAATNRFEDIDPAILRRLPLKFEIPMPGVLDRLQILEIHLKGTNLAPDVDLELLARMADGMSGSDLQEMCRRASVSRVSEYMNSDRMSNGLLRDLTMEDLTVSLQLTRMKGSSFSPVRHLWS